MSTQHGQELQSAKREGGGITASRTIQTPSALIQLTGTLTGVDRTYRQIVKFLLQNGYKLTPLTKTEPAPPGEVEPCHHQEEIDRLVDQGMEMVSEIQFLRQQLERATREITRLRSVNHSLEEVISSVTG
jgi:hypothetical protein